MVAVRSHTNPNPPFAEGLLLTHSIGFKSSATLKGASVLLFTSSTVTPSAISIKVSPVAKSTSNTPYTRC